MASTAKALRLPVRPCYRSKNPSHLIGLGYRRYRTQQRPSTVQHTRIALPASHNRRQRYYTATQDLQSPFSATETTILSASLAHVPTHGFTKTAFLHGITDAGYIPATTNLFPRGPVDLIFYHTITARQSLAAAFPSPFSDNSSTTSTSAPLPSAATITERTIALLLHRLHANGPVNAHIPGALAQLAQPSYVPAAVADLAALADEIVYLSGATALDTSWYTHRAGIGAVYAASELFMTQDTSEGFRETEAFVRRRIEGLNRAAWVKNSVGEWVGFTAVSTVNLLRNWGMRI